MNFNNYQQNEITQKIEINETESKCKNSNFEIENLKIKETIIDVIQNLIIRPENDFKINIIQILLDIIPITPTYLISKKILPIIIEFSMDSDKLVKLLSLKALGKITLMIEDNNDFQKIETQFEQFLTISEINEKDIDIKYETLKILIKIVPKVKQLFREKFIFKKFYHITLENNTNPNEDDKKKIIALLIKYYKALNGCLSTRENIKRFIIPGLDYLIKDIDCMNDIDITQSIKNMLKDIELVTKKNI